MDVTYLTDIGKKRANNQDYVAAFQNKAGVLFAIVADGMGGHLGGDVASEMAVSQIGHDFKLTDLHDSQQLSDWLQNELTDENDRIINASSRFADLNGMGTTFVAIMIWQQHYLMTNIGDSRGYLWRDQQLTQITEDHSLVNELVKYGKISPEEAKHHPQKNVITRTLGVSKDVQPDFREGEWQANDLFLLCSDGLTNMVPDELITDILKAEVPNKERAQRLVVQANANGGLDNITVLMVQPGANQVEVQP
ncbi:Stp1/IreP family PP2C-type Ser/Thr phosphatase [Lapidilactobacillus gannanensis]|jgi:protein phosphatase|uniref:Stp1/IreP family PP2C-type Ser/Thr phosphatase n=1 Tax=Lapidilactobacillus gannanensis TaxID=2486002 RepID=A0ABW4BQU5_9LACO|nr:Stp1/IreP family PP2C-type Ser/Thr phosphatase [Lapidilactobacillus gannanensis]MCH4058066.1 Stp1/IreP family PP2C-type Ser/Thr phosphatase [Lactobacillaceae bacterium]